MFACGIQLSLVGEECGIHSFVGGEFLDVWCVVAGAELGCIVHVMLCKGFEC